MTEEKANPSDVTKLVEVTIKHQMSVHLEHGITMLTFEASSPLVLDDEGQEIPFSFDLPMPFLASQGEVELEAYKVLLFSRNMLPVSLLQLSGSVFRFLANCYFTNKKLLPGAFADAVHAFEKDVAGDVRTMVGLPKRGNPSKWRDDELRARLQSMVNKKPVISWDEIYDTLKETDPDRVSESSRALREVARTKGILMRDMRRTAKIQTKKDRVNGN